MVFKCNKCLQSTLYSKMTIIPVENRPFKCLECNSEYTSEKNLERHFNQKHSLDPKFMCPSCGKKLGGKRELERHVETHDTKNFFKHSCPICGKRSKTSGSSESHIKYNHTKDKNFVCIFCPKKFPFASIKEVHERSAHSQQDPISYVSCEKCGGKFKSLRNLKSHNMIHTGEKPHKCTFCEKTFQQSHQKKAHEAYIHAINSETSYKCKICGKSYKDPVYKEMHQKRHSNLTYCNLCDINVKWFEAHKKTHLAKGQEAKCKFCPLLFVTRWLKRKHEKAHTKIDKSVKCKFCDYRAPSNRDFVRHKATHSCEKMHKCISCGFTTKLLLYLNMHRKKVHETHMIKKVECKICAKKVKNLWHHSLNHREINEHICSICSKSFKLKSGLVHHREIHQMSKKSTM